MHSKRNRTPRWILLNLIMLAALGGLALEHGLHLNSTGHKITLFLFIIVFYGLMGLWVKSNATALEDQDAEERRILSHDLTHYRAPAPPARNQPTFQDTVSYYRPEPLNKREKR